MTQQSQILDQLKDGAKSYSEFTNIAALDIALDCLKRSRKIVLIHGAPCKYALPIQPSPEREPKIIRIPIKEPMGFHKRVHAKRRTCPTCKFRRRESLFIGEVCAYCAGLVRE